jgi:hypothetical protein
MTKLFRLDKAPLPLLRPTVGPRLPVKEGRRRFSDIVGHATRAASSVAVLYCHEAFASVPT